MKNYLILFFIIFINITGFTQVDFGKRFTAGASLTYVPNGSVRIPVEDWIHEWTLNANITSYITEKFSLGISGMFNRSYQRGDQQFYKMFGSFVQFDITKIDRHRLFAESGLFIGDYCSCGLFEPYRQSNLKYFSIGGGYEWQFSPRFNLEFGLLFYHILDNIEEKYGNHQYIFGINYTIGKPWYDYKK